MQLPAHTAEAYSLVAAGRAAEALLLLSRMAVAGDGPALYQLLPSARGAAML